MWSIRVDVWRVMALSLKNKRRHIPTRLFTKWRRSWRDFGKSNLKLDSLSMMESSSWWLLDSWRWIFNQSLWDKDFEPEGFPIRKVVNLLGRWEVFIQIKSPAMIAATRMLLASIWHLNEDRTWLRWVLDWDRVVCWRNASRSEFGTTLLEFAEKAEAKRNFCWYEVGSFLNLSFLSSLSDFFSFRFVFQAICGNMDVPIEWVEGSVVCTCNVVWVWRSDIMWEDVFLC